MVDERQIEAVLLDMRNQFVDEIPERCLRMEALLRIIAADGHSGEAFDELYRHVHSLKGSGGTHGLPVISNICHHFENFLTDANARSQLSAQAFSSQALGYCDLLASTADCLRRGVSTLEKEQALELLFNQRVDRQRVALVAESSKAMQGLLRSTLSGHGLKVVMVKSGLQALARLIHEPIDLLVVGNELDELGGQAVIAALRESHGRNHDIPVVLVKSATSSVSERIKVSAVLTRDAQMVDRLVRVLDRIFQKE